MSDAISIANTILFNVYNWHTQHATAKEVSTLQRQILVMKWRLCNIGKVNTPLIAGRALQWTGVPRLWYGTS
jgi:hypothetical protein